MIVKSVLFVFLAWAGWEDLKKRKVPNRLILAGLIAGIALRGWRFFPGAAALFVPAWLFFSMNLLGGADAKMLALTGGFLGIFGSLISILLGMTAALVRDLYNHVQTAGLSEFSIRWLHPTAILPRIIHIREQQNKKEIPLVFYLAVGYFVYLFLPF